MQYGRARAGEGAQAAQDLPGDRCAHCRAAGLGSRIWHHRFPDTARSKAALIRCTEPLSRAAHAVRLRALRRAVALGFALAACILSYWLLRVRGPLSLPQRAQWLHGAACRVARALGI